MDLCDVLICDDDSLFHMTSKDLFKGKARCRSAYHSDEAIAILRNHPVDIILLDVQMRTGNEGVEAIPKFKELNPDVSIIMLSGLTDFPVVREAMRLGATDYVPKGANPEELLLAFERVKEKRELGKKSTVANAEVTREQRRHVMVGNHPSIQALRRTLERIRQHTANVVITGETGTGKEIVARQLRGVTPDGTLAPFVAVDSSTIQSSTAESQLFGHERGAFTGADQPRRGLFEEADGGIIYFDEISNMPMDIQAKLLRVIQEKEFLRLGSSRLTRSDFRVICATNQNLEDLVKSGRFKPDLLQRLNVIPIEVLPLRDRKEDIPLLADHFLRQQPGHGLHFSESALAALTAYSWPGNVRELSNLVAYLNAMTEGAEIEITDLPLKFQDCSRRSPAVGKTGTANGGSYYQRVAVHEKEILAAEYARLEGNVSKMATELEMDRSYLHAKLKEFGIHSPKKRGT